MTFQAVKFLFCTVIKLAMAMNSWQQFVPDANWTVGLVIVHEREQKEIPQLVANAVQCAVAKLPDLAVNEYYIEYARDSSIFADDPQWCSVLERGVSVVLDLTWTDTGYIRNAASAAGVPYFHADVSIQTYLNLLENYLRYRSGSDAVYILNGAANVDAAICYLISESQLRTIVFDRIDDDVVERIKAIRPYPSYYAIVANADAIHVFIRKAKAGGLLRKPAQWNLFYTDVTHGDELEFNDSYAEVNRFRVSNETCCTVKDNTENHCSCPKGFQPVVEHLNNLIEVLLSYAANFKWSMTDQCVASGTNNKTNAFDQSEIWQSITEDLRFAVSHRKRLIRYNMSISVYSSSQDDPSKKVDIGKIVNGNVLLAEDQVLQPVRRFFRVGTTEAVPWAYRKRDTTNGAILRNNDGEVIWEGYCIDFLQKLSKVMDFDYHLVSPFDGTFGTRNLSGNWNGLIGDLVRGDIDFAMASMKMTAEREEVVDFVAPYFEVTGILIAMRKPVRETSLFKFMTVLRLEVWVSILLAIIATAIMLWLLDKFSPYSAQNNKNAYPYACRDFTLKESFWFALTSFTPQGGGEAPKALSGRTLVAAYWLFVVLMLATFTANLAAFLTVERMQTPVQSLEQLARQSRIKYTVVQNSNTHDYFKNMKNAEDVLYQMWRNLTLSSDNDQAQYRVWDYPIKEQYINILAAIESASPVKSAEEGFQRVNERLDADFAFIHDSAEIKYEISRNCNLTEVGEIFAEQPYAIAVQQGSHLQDEISYYILELQKERYFEALSAKFWNNSARGVCPNTDDSEGITLESLGGVFIATLVGLALAMITLFGEVLYYRSISKRPSITKVGPFNIAMEKKHTKKSKLSSLKRWLDCDARNTDKPLAKKQPAEVTIGNNFIPAAEKQRQLSYITT